MRTLSNAIERDRIHHAYLFVGSRGTGKTSMAKILARSLNCVEGPTLTPCGKCESCLSIASGSSMDVIEMDAASNRSVEDIRDLRERVGYASAAGRWKVYILDEAHMLTREAWNAFLKTLEEPPPSTVFVLATTEAHKVMPTIVDRCQRFDFARPSPDEIAVVIERASAAEGIEPAEGVVGAIARSANGSFRDALGTLDQLVAYSGERIALDDALTVLGVADSELLFAAADAIGAGDGKRILEVSSTLSRSGHDPGRFAGSLISHLRQLLVIATLGSIPDHFLVVAEHRERIAAQAERLGEVTLLRAIDELAAALAAIREGDEARMTVELALLRAARPEIDPSRAALIQRIERLERGQGGTVVAATPAKPEATHTPPPTAAGSTPAVGGSEHLTEAASSAGPEVVADPAAPPAAAAPQAPTDSTPPPAADLPSPEPPPSPAAEPPAAAEPVAPSAPPPTAAAPAPSAESPLASFEAVWPSVVDHMRQSGASLLAAVVSEARPVMIDEAAEKVRLGFPSDAAFNQRKANDKENRDRVAGAVREVTGRALHPEFVILDASAGEAPPAPPQPLDENELVEKFISEFDAEILEDEVEGGGEGADGPQAASEAAQPANEEAN